MPLGGNGVVKEVFKGCARKETGEVKQRDLFSMDQLHRYCRV